MIANRQTHTHAHTLTDRHAYHHTPLPCRGRVTKTATALLTLVAQLCGRVYVTVRCLSVCLSLCSQSVPSIYRLLQLRAAGLLLWAPRSIAAASDGAQQHGGRQQMRAVSRCQLTYEAEDRHVTYIAPRVRGRTRSLRSDSGLNSVQLHIAQLMPLPLTVSCFSKIQIGITFLVPAHLGSPGKRAVKCVCVCVCVLNSVQFIKQQRTKDHLQVASTYNTVIAHRVPTMYTQYV